MSVSATEDLELLIQSMEENGKIKKNLNQKNKPWGSNFHLGSSRVLFCFAFLGPD